MKKIIAVVLMLGTFLCMTACQATPEQDIIVQKDAERMIEQAANKSNGTQLDSLAIPEGRYTYVSTGADGRLHINVDAAIEKPDSGNMPIARASIGSFSQETVTAIFNYLFQDKKPFNRITVQTKADIQSVLVNMKKQLADGSYKDNDYTEEEFKALIADKEAQYDTAPETAPEKTVSNGTMTISQEKGGYMLDVESDTAWLQVMTSADPADQTTSNKKGGRYCMLNYTRTTAPQYNTLGITQTDGTNISDDAKGKLTIPYTDAKALCDGFFAAAGMSGDFCVGASFIVDDRGTGLVDVKYVDGKYVEGPKKPAENYAYQFYYTRKVGNIPVALNARAGGSTGDEFSVPWGYEYSCFTVDNNGMANIFWTDSINVGEVVEKSVTLKSFEEIMQVFETMIKTTYVAYMDTYYSGHQAQMAVNVDDIQLCLLRVREQNGDETAGLLVPAWVFYGHSITKNYDNNVVYDSIGGGATRWPEAPIVLLAINAIDGSIIDIAKGY